MSAHDRPFQAGEWFATPLGQYLLGREQSYFDNAVADVFGYNAFQLGPPDIDFLRASRIPLRCRVNAAGAAGLRADFRDLPIASNSADLVVLPHALEFNENPHQILREVARVLLPEAQMVISCFNPWSLRGLRLIMPRWTDRLAPKKSLAAVPKKVARPEEAFTARNGVNSES